jgi:hypothetical protein
VTLEIDDGDHDGGYDDDDNSENNNRIRLRNKHQTDALSF